MAASPNTDCGEFYGVRKLLRACRCAGEQRPPMRRLAPSRLREPSRVENCNDAVQERMSASTFCLPVAAVPLSAITSRRSVDSIVDVQDASPLTSFNGEA